MRIEKWKIHHRTETKGLCKPGIWITTESGRTVVDTGAIDVWPLSDADLADLRRRLENK